MPPRCAETGHDPLSIDVVDDPIACSRCDAVCCRLPVLLLPGDEVPRWLIEVDTYGPDRMAQWDDGWCAALDRHTMRCSIYAQRPQICRDFAMGGADCKDERSLWRGHGANADSFDSGDD